MEMTSVAISQSELYIHYYPHHSISVCLFVFFVHISQP